jgi:hypothetical protein
LGLLQFDETEIQFVAGDATAEGTAAFRAHAGGESSFEVVRARYAMLHAMSTFDLEPRAFATSIPGEDLEAEAQGLGIYAGERAEADTDLRDPRGLVLLNDERDAFEDRGGDSDFVH